MENNEDSAVDFKQQKQVVQWVLSLTKEEGSQVYTALTPSEWKIPLDSISALSNIVHTIVVKDKKVEPS